MRDVEFYYDFSSPNAYLVHKVLPTITARYDAQVISKPILLGGVFKSTNNQAPMLAFKDIPGKVDYMRVEMARFLERHQTPFLFNPHFPVNSLNLMRAAVFAQGKPWESKYIDAIFDAMWVQGKALADIAVITDVLDAADLPTRDIMNASQDADIKSNLADVTAAAVARGIYGSPAMFIGDEMFYGKDSLSDLEWRLGQ
ncbi:DsbA family protein [Pseudosulfitobacter sp. SM2401]|uniref:2-hydroxychromene-2-carboxylate isomerase n=1 Tax=Pseudosulfitobacter sp. SM2401 TaxID=3350098 RepID=UPI0036F309EC